ncbi:histidine kinase dimerization/phospho-acceptor domain-containing protein, partial [Alcaligenes faecalis]|uniref:histidine kinase dimerization/phospho-acceptor domain-containing protein n=1 Tax=Alcaligenes faecalis TaxID=511 RepID=UPI00287F7D3E
PLYGVLGSLELLSMTELDGQQHQQVDRIQGASRQLLQIISDILDISRIEAGQTNVQTVPLDPVALVQDCTAKSAFLATMSHEIRTPLYGVLGSLELLSMTELDGQQHQQVDRIQGASRQLLQIISDILDISRIEAGQTNVQTVPLDPVALVQDCT